MNGQGPRAPKPPDFMPQAIHGALHGLVHGLAMGWWLIVLIVLAGAGRLILRIRQERSRRAPLRLDR
jgi:hypothetical protein